MSCCSTCSFDPCRCGGDFTVVDGLHLERSLIGSLTGCVDQIRDIYSCLGARAYTVALVSTRWSGGERGEGVEEVVREMAILPTPLVSDLTAIANAPLSIGDEEMGEVRVSQISPRFNEDELRGRSIDGAAVSQDENFYWEIRFPRSDGTAVRRRFTPNSAPSYNPTAFEWAIRLLKVYEDRTRAGDPVG